jgi:CRP-like cAMP-binding protein
MVLFREGSNLNRFFLVVEGKAALEMGGEGQEPRRILTVGPGELLGWSPLFSQPFMTATVRTLTPTHVVSINAAQALELCRDSPRFGYLFMQRTGEALAVRLNAFRRLLLDVLRDDLPPEKDEPGAGD